MEQDQYSFNIKKIITEIFEVLENNGLKPKNAVKKKAFRKALKKIIVESLEY